MPKNPLVLMLLCVAVAIWQIIELSGGGEAPSQAVRLLHYVLLACALVGAVGGGIRYVTEKAEEKR